MTTWRASVRAVAVALVAATVAAPGLSGCTGGSLQQEPSPEEVLQNARQRLDETSGVRFRVRADDVPQGARGLVRAVGVGTHDPAFEGDLKVAAGGVGADIAVVAAHGKVYAKLPFTERYTEIDPSNYAAPDPAALMRADGGLSSLLGSAEEVAEQHDGTYTARLPGEAVEAVIPTASEAADYRTTFTVVGDRRLRRATVRGPFFEDGTDHTYTITFLQYDIEAEITPP